MAKKYCSDCNNEIICSVDGECWCSNLPAVMPVKYGQGCRCQSCLAKLITLSLNETIEKLTLQEMLDYAKKYNRDKQLVEYIDYTIENGYHVFSRWHHLKRGSCCGNGCRHCPY